MPYQRYEEDGKWCVYKINEQTKEKLDKMGCSDSENAALAHMRALYAAENKSMPDNDELAFQKAYPKNRDDLKDSDFVLPNERTFPVVIAADVMDAVNSWGRYKGEASFETFKKNLTALAKRKGFESSLPKEWKDEMSSKKSMDDLSYNDLMDNIRRDFETQNYASIQEDFPKAYCWIADYYQNYIIVDTNDGCFQVNYYRKDGKYIFDDKSEWKPVERKTEWVKKSIKSFNSGTAVKQLDSDRIGTYGVIWGDENNKDLTGEWFTPDTEELLDVFKSIGVIPWLFNHAEDGIIKTAVVGIVDKMEPDEYGVWYEAKIKEHDLYKKYVQRFVDEEKLFSSSGTLPRARKVAKSGQILRWPIVEMTGTHKPAEWRMLNMPVEEIVGHYKSIGIDSLNNNIFNEAAGSEEEQKTKLKIELELRKAALRINGFIP